MTLLDPANIGPRLVGRIPGEVRIRSAHLLSVSPGQRAVVLLRTDAPGPDLIAKLYADPRRAARLYRLLGELPGVPPPVAHVPELGICIYEASTGRPIDELPDEDRAAAVASAAEWLAALHGADLRFDRRLHLATELDNAGTWAERVAAGLPACGARARQLVDRLRSEAPPVPDTIPMHKDFQYQHTLFEDGQLVVIDLDEMRAGDPALDVAHFAANLRLLERRSGTASLEKAFLRAYPESWPEKRLRFWSRYTFLKLAKQIVRGRGPAPVPAGRDRDDEVAWALAEGLR
ncbi:MAG: phosphotransferase family protein [Acidimicrobiales bacterium]